MVYSPKSSIFRAKPSNSMTRKRTAVGSDRCVESLCVSTLYATDGHMQQRIRTRVNDRTTRTRSEATAIPKEKRFRIARRDNDGVVSHSQITRRALRMFTSTRYVTRAVISSSSSSNVRVRHALSVRGNATLPVQAVCSFWETRSADRVRTCYLLRNTHASS